VPKSPVARIGTPDAETVFNRHPVGYRKSFVLYLWVRATADWSDAQAFRAQLQPPYAPKVAL